MREFFARLVVENAKDTDVSALFVSYGNPGIETNVQFVGDYFLAKLLIQTVSRRLPPTYIAFEPPVQQSIKNDEGFTVSNGKFSIN
jgi:hypothetical protein